MSTDDFEVSFNSSVMKLSRGKFGRCRNACCNLSNVAELFFIQIGQENSFVHTIKQKQLYRI